MNKICGVCGLQVAQRGTVYGISGCSFCECVNPIYIYEGKPFTAFGPVTTEPQAAPSGEKEYNSESLNLLKAWVHWALLNPFNKDQEMHANATDELFTLLGIRNCQLAKAEAALAKERDRAKDLVAALHIISDRAASDEMGGWLRLEQIRVLANEAIAKYEETK